ncbi:hypothetical protein AGABI2DRAFT_179752 [Agaricus bisporus var. bisporus H97]|uniref:hypothetical protein n=1 Tax=Agaricus bisporus var. bisporus (strain H97 / ATCC MYA-4626 / FGSC 10389) TaxID=936046 RepID=UPI00029F6DC7|nr:hypothetical protein AGABI2DRAFT_179752 [Agaricus bisporus var. bisporus H97]EKV45242.1 hypothetical protein AGABI2DRAFT_179752 [Agaricus bisporus var. bisporus H97]
MSLPDKPGLRSPNVRRRRPSMRMPSLGTSSQRLTTTPMSNSNGKHRTSVSGHTAAAKTQRTSKTSQKLVVLPSAPQTRPLLASDEEDLMLGVEIREGVREFKSEAERMTKEQRKEAGYKRLTAYCVAEAFKMKLLASYLKREHNVGPRIFDEALYAMYYLPLLPGYGPGVNVRSSAPAPVAQGVSYLSEAEENGYQGLYFTQPTERTEEEMRDGYISSDSPVFNREVRPSGNTPMVAIPVAEQTHSPASLTDGGGGGEVQSNHSLLSDSEVWTDTAVRTPTRRTRTVTEDTFPPTPKIYSEHENVEVIFFEYGVVVFFGLTEAQEKDILEDIDNAGIMKRKINYDHWEVEECHFTHDPHISYPRIYNDFFNVPELFWSEASLKDLYDAVREYMEIGPRVQVLNEKLGVASGFLDAIHDHLNNSAMERITWIVIWLIVVAILVELGEVLARLVVHATIENVDGINITAATITTVLPNIPSSTPSKEELLRTLERMVFAKDS